MHLPLFGWRHAAASWLSVSVAGSFVLYGVLFLLMRAGSMRRYNTPVLDGWPWLRALSDRLAPDALVTATPQSPQATANAVLYGLLVVGLVGLWALALQSVRSRSRPLQLRWLLLLQLLFSVPLVSAAGLFSRDIYLYMFYGRILARYEENPFLVVPSRFAGDSHLPWAPWQDLPSAYGPVWLMLSGALSALAGDSLLVNLLTYKAAFLALHMLTTVAVWEWLRQARSELATWGAVFYGWNPLVLVETVGNGHNDVMVTLLAVLSLLAARNRRWLYAVLFLTVAAMVKLTAVVLLPVLLIGWLLSLSTLRDRLRAVIGASAVAASTALLLYLPLWAGDAMIENVLQNPAVTRYQNSLWETVAYKLGSSHDEAALAGIYHYLGPIRNLALAGAFLFLVRRLLKGMDLPDAWVWLWFAYTVSLSWIWPWYFVLPVALAALCGPGRASALAVGLTLGGMLFWLGWPDDLAVAPWLFEHRALILFGPAVVAALLPGLSPLRSLRSAPLRQAE